MNENIIKLKSFGHVSFLSFYSEPPENYCQACGKKAEVVLRIGKEKIRSCNKSSCKILVAEMMDNRINKTGIA